MVWASPRIRDAQNSLGFWDINGSTNLHQTTRLSDSQQKKKKKKKKKRTCQIVNFAVPSRHRLKLNENETRNKYLDLARYIYSFTYFYLIRIILYNLNHSFVHS